jgi:hypothetical protein
MKKTILLLTGVLLSTILLAACNKSTSQSNTSDNNSANSSQAGTSLSQVNLLLVGTLKLENTAQAVTKDEAAQLLPLWQAYRSLSTSQTSAEAEVEALLKQIQSTMTTSQVQAIQAMELTSTDMVSLMQTLGPAMGPQGTPNPQGTPPADLTIIGGMPPNDGNPSSGATSGGTGNGPSGSTGGTTRNMPPGGMVIQGGPGGDAGSAAGLGGSPMTQGTPDPSMQATAQARFSTQASRVNTILLDVLINKLTTLTGG